MSDTATITALMNERNRLARALADRNDEYDTLSDRFDAFAETCADHCVDRAAEQVAAEDLKAAYDRLGAVARRLVETATAYRSAYERLRAHGDTELFGTIMKPVLHRLTHR